jgi:lipopolysaccharide heptosyltransferase II
MKQPFKTILKTPYLNLRKGLLHAVLGKQNLKNQPCFRFNHFLNILFLRIDRIGDMVLSTPAIKAIKQSFPGSSLTVLASESNHMVLLNNPYVDHIMVYPKPFRKQLEMIQRIQNLKFDLVIDPYPDYELKTALIAFLSRGKYRIGYPGFGREAFFNLKSSESPGRHHFIHQTLDMLKPLGILASDPIPEIHVTQDEKIWARNWLKQRGLGKKPIIGIHPGAYYETQQWPVEYYAEVAEGLSKYEMADVIVFGGPGDKSIVNQIAGSLSNNIFSMITKCLRHFIAMLPFCRMLICNNSGPLHLAVAARVPTISFMGPTDKDRWMPVGSIHKVLRMDHLPCIGCNSGYCVIKNHDCMRFIDSATVIQTIKNHIGVF